MTTPCLKLFVQVVTVGFSVVTAQWHEVDYNAISVWPQPRNVTLPDIAAGPHAINHANVRLDISDSCGPRVKPLVVEVLSLPTTHFRAPVRTYAEAAYATLDNASCSMRCLSDDDCSSDIESTFSVCYIRSDLRWSSTQPCSPSSTLGLNAPCGCCVASLPLPEVPVILSLIHI